MITLPAPHVLRALDDLVQIGLLALEAWAIGDRQLLSDCERWHARAWAVVAGARGVA